MDLRDRRRAVGGKVTCAIALLLVHGLFAFAQDNPCPGAVFLRETLKLLDFDSDRPSWLRYP